MRFFNTTQTCKQCSTMGIILSSTATALTMGSLFMEWGDGYKPGAFICFLAASIGILFFAQEAKKLYYFYRSQEIAELYEPINKDFIP